ANSRDEAKRVASRLLIHHAVAQRADAGKRRQHEAPWIGNFVGGGDPGAERAGGGGILSRSHREFLIVAHAPLDGTGVAGDVIARARPPRAMTTASSPSKSKLCDTAGRIISPSCAGNSRARRRGNPGTAAARPDWCAAPPASRCR